VIEVLTRLPALSIVTLQHCPLGDFNIIPLPISSIYVSPLFTCKEDFAGVGKGDGSPILILLFTPVIVNGHLDVL
jgi:hypothetical protein